MVSSFFPYTAKLWNSLSIECFPLTYDLNCFKSRIRFYIYIYIYIYIYAGIWFGYLQDNVGWGRKWLFDFNAGIINLMLWMGLFLGRNHVLRCWGCLSLLNWIGSHKLSLLLKLHPRKMEPYSFYEVSFSWGYLVSQ